MVPQLYETQLQAVERMHDGCILCGKVGTGKSITSLAYYFRENGGDIRDLRSHMKKNPLDLYIITTAMKRDKGEWENELSNFHLTASKDPKAKSYDHTCVIDSWNNIKKYTDVAGAFFIFDEQRVVGKGTWVESFLKIAKHNRWILLSATPGDKWEDYIPVFIANGFYRNRTAFHNEHTVMNNYGGYWKIERYLNVGRLIRLRNNILVQMESDRKIKQLHLNYDVRFDKGAYGRLMNDRWNIWENKPIESVSELCYSLRKVVNSDPDRASTVLEIWQRLDLKRVIIFYNFDYELDILKSLDYGPDAEVAEWNGHKHQSIPEGNTWVYLVQYNAGAEGWNCIRTNTIIFYSQNYSYRTMLQAAGRIDRRNTPFDILTYYHLVSSAPIDRAIKMALMKKKKFNEGKFYASVIA